MARSEFLSKFWNPYPAMKTSALDVSGALLFLEQGKAGEIFVGGRLSGVAGEFSVASNGRDCAIQFDQKCKWSNSTAAFSEAVLASGDIVLLKGKIDSLVDSVVIHVCEVELLAPALQTSKHNTSLQVDLLKNWSEFVQVVRGYFLRNEFVECQTPTLVPAPGTEPYLDVFTTQFKYGRFALDYYLPTSPEFHLKKLLARGLTRIFEIRSCFRNGEVSDHHQPEFQMLEWYRAYSGLDSIISDIEGLLSHLQSNFRERSIGKVKVVTMAQLFEANCDFNLQPNTSREELFVLCSNLDLKPSHDDTWDDLFFRVVIEKIEPNLDRDTPTIVRGYPQPQAALARLNESGWGERFEFYWKGLEIANAFDELNDPKQNEKRFESDLKKRVASGRREHPLDTQLIADFYSGMPPAGGIALGVERLFMALFDVKNISDLKPFVIKL